MQPLLECEEPVSPSMKVVFTAPLLECVGPLPPSPDFVRTHLAGRSCHRCLRARACIPSCARRLYRRRGMLTKVHCHCLRVRDLHPVRLA